MLTNVGSSILDWNRHFEVDSLSSSSDDKLCSNSSDHSSHHGITLPISDIDQTSSSSDNDGSSDTSVSSYKAVTMKKASLRVAFTTPSNNKVVPSKTMADVRDGVGQSIAHSDADKELGTSFPQYVEFMKGHYCPNDINEFLPCTFQAEEPTYCDDEMIQLIQHIINSDSPIKSSHPFMWTMDDEAAQHNQSVLETYQFDLDKCLKSDPSSICHPGSEFLDVSLLEPILRRHPHWTLIKKILQDGAQMHQTEEVPTENRHLENQALIDYNNHKGARDNMDVILSTVLDDIKHGYAIVLPLGTERLLPMAMLCPVGVVKQNTLTNNGQVAQKTRLTHDQTFVRLVTSKSVNMITDLSQFPCMIYGWTLVRLIHQIVIMRYRYPNEIILVINGNYKSAYHRLHYNWLSAQQCIIYLLGYLIMWRRLCFGGSGCPPTWCMMGEMAADLGNDLLQNTAFQWEAITSRYKAQIRKPQRMDSSVSIASALPMMVAPPVREYGYLNIFVDNIIGMVVDRKDNYRRLGLAMAISVKTISRPETGGETLPRSDNLHPGKTFVEGAASEQILVLGWLLDLRQLLIILPQDKYVSWTKDIVDILKIGKLNKKRYETLIGRLSHTACGIPMSRYFM